MNKKRSLLREVFCFRSLVVFLVFAFQSELWASGYQSLAEISTRANVGINEDVEIVGFIIKGPQVKRVLIRGLGPTLADPPSSLAGTLANPYLKLYDSHGALIAQNDNWRSSADAEAITATNVPPRHDTESAILKVLYPGPYTAILSGVANTTGLGLLEVYDMSGVKDSTGNITSYLANVSTRGKIGTGNNVMIAGLIVKGSDPKNVVIRGLGPSLDASLQAPILANPFLSFYNGNGQLLAQNDDWRVPNQQQIVATGVAPTNDREAALKTTVTAGAYTAVLSGVSSSALGIGLIDAYDLSPPSAPSPTPAPTFVYVDDSEVYSPTWAGNPRLLKSSPAVSSPGGQLKVYLSAKSLSNSGPTGRGYLSVHLVDVGTNALITTGEFRPGNQGNIYVSGIVPFGVARNTPVRVEIWAMTASSANDSDFVFNLQFEISVQ